MYAELKTQSEKKQQTFEPAVQHWTTIYISRTKMWKH